MSNLLQKLSAFSRNLLHIKPNNESPQIKSSELYTCRTEYEEKIYRWIRAIQVELSNFHDFEGSKNYYDLLYGLKYDLLDYYNSHEQIYLGLLEEGITTLNKINVDQANAPINVASDYQYPLADTVMGILLAKQGKIEEAIACHQNASYKQTYKSYPALVKDHWSTNVKGKPNFLIPGFIKCGTTSLYQYLTAHPQVLPAIDKEIHFFTNSFEYGINFYQSHFPSILDKPEYITGEASPIYIYDSKRTPQKILNFFPDIKLIIILRNPIERTISSYSFFGRSIFEQNKLESTISVGIEYIQSLVDNSCDLLSIPDLYCGDRIHLFHSMYICHLREWLNVFPEKQFLILKSEDLLENPSSTMKLVYSFLGLPDHQISTYKKFNANSYPEISDDLRFKLKEFYRPYNQELEEYLGMKFDWD